MRFAALTFLIFAFSCARKHEKVEVYLVKNIEPQYANSMDDNCRYCFDLNKAELDSHPLISNKDIVYFDWKNQRIQLTKACHDKILELKITMAGLPAVMTVNKRPIYEIWLWSEYSSFACDRVCFFPKNDGEIFFGFPEKYKKGPDPRFNDVLKKTLIRLELLH